MKENLELKFSVVIRSITMVDDAFCLSARPMLMHTCMLGGRQAAGMIHGCPSSTVDRDDVIEITRPNHASLPWPESTVPVPSFHSSDLQISRR
jgi:hypothetical protein